MSIVAAVMPAAVVVVPVSVIITPVMAVVVSMVVIAAARTAGAGWSLEETFVVVRHSNSSFFIYDMPGMDKRLQSMVLL